MATALKAIGVALATIVGVVAAIAQIIDYATDDKSTFLWIAVVLIFSAVPIATMVVILVRQGTGGGFSWNLFRAVAAASATVATVALATAMITLISGITSRPVIEPPQSSSVATPPATQSTGDAQVASTTIGRIESPSAQETVPMVITAAGTATGLPPGSQLWLLVEFVPDGPYFPAAIVQDGDRWRAKDLYVGGDGQAGQSFVLNLAAFDAAAQAQLEVYFKRERERHGAVGLRRGELTAWNVRFLSAVPVVRAP